jgi:hypothetical protein
MRTLLALVILAVATPAWADDFGDAPKPSAKKCRSPPCRCQDGTQERGCVDKDACDTFCLDHDGPVAWHKKHKKHRGSSESSSSDF